MQAIWRYGLAFALAMQALNTGCTSFMTGSREPVVRAIDLPGHHPAVSYSQALRVAHGMGMTITSHDAPRQFQGQLHNAVQMSVTVEKQGLGSRVLVYANLLSNKVVFGRFTEADDFAQALRREATLN